MKIGSSIGLMALGAILAFAVRDAIDGVDLTLVGYILIGAGLIGLIASMFLSRPRENRIANTSHSTVTPNGDRITHSETTSQ